MTDITKQLADALRRCLYLLEGGHYEDSEIYRTAMAQLATYEAQAAEPKQEPIAAFDAAIALELSRVSRVEYDGHEICKHFAGKVRERIAEAAPVAQAAEPKQEPVAWASLTANGQIAYFDGKPMVMPGPVGNECHQTPLYPPPVAQAEDRHEKTRGDVAQMFDQAVSLAQELDHYWTGSRWVKDGSHTPVVKQEVVSKPGSTLEVTRCKLSTSMRNGLSAPVAEIGGGMAAPKSFEGAGGGRCAVGGHVDGSVVHMTPTDETGTVAFPVDSLQRASAPSTNEPAVPQKYEPLNDDERTELVHLRSLVNTPQLHDFAHAVVLESAHQRERWGSGHDAGKAPQDWFWLLGYLGGKALAAHTAGNTEKALHHTISSAAALANWHAAISGSHTTMRPGIDPSAHGIKENP